MNYVNITVSSLEIRIRVNGKGLSGATPGSLGFSGAPGIPGRYYLNLRTGSWSDHP